MCTGELFNTAVRQRMVRVSRQTWRRKLFSKKNSRVRVTFSTKMVIIRKKTILKSKAFMTIDYSRINTMAVSNNQGGETH